MRNVTSFVSWILLQIMKRNYFLLSFLLFGFVANAQTATTAKKAEPPLIARTASLISFEATLVSGKLNLFKTLTRDPETSNTSLSYILTGSENPKNFNSGKPLGIKLSRDFFDGAFMRSSPEIADKFASLTRFVQDKNLSLNDEKGWISLINYYNSL